LSELFSRRSYVSPRIAEAYVGKTDKTIQRDINVLIEMDLVKRTGKGIQIRQELMSAFLQRRR